MDNTGSKRERSEEVNDSIFWMTLTESVERRMWKTAKQEADRFGMSMPPFKKDYVSTK